MASNPYLVARIRDALAQSGGDGARAQRLILQWAGRDDRLLRTLVGPHIRGIVAQAVERQAGRPAAAAAGGGAPSPAKALTATTLDAVVGRMGERFGGIVEQPRGMSAFLPGSRAKPPDAGDRHAESLRTLAVAFARKRFDP